MELETFFDNIHSFLQSGAAFEAANTSYVYTSASESLCGMTLELNKKYLISGKAHKPLDHWSIRGRGKTHAPHTIGPSVVRSNDCTTSGPWSC